MRELEFVRQLRQQFTPRPPVKTGIGDDGAVLTGSDGRDLVVVTDMLLDDVHFSLSTTSATLIGRKAVAVNLSDLAAMGCRPTAAFVSIAVPKSAALPDFLSDLYQGIGILAEELDFTVAGGDTNLWNGPFAINVCLTGEPYGERAILRCGAQPGDSLLVTGSLGGSLNSGRHLSFAPRLDVAEVLATNIDVHAMIDISDGLSIDLHRLMDAGNVGSVLKAADVPVHHDVPDTRPPNDRLHAAMSDGEDFELLIAVPPDCVNTARLLVESACGLQLTVIGAVTAELGCRLLDFEGNVNDLSVSGWEHG